MITQPQVTNKYTMKELFQKFISRAHIYLPEWDPNREHDAGAALVQIFLEMFDQVRLRLNRMPEKSLFAFMDSLGIDLLPAQSAKAWVAFTAIPEAPANAIVPIGSALSGKGKDASGKDVDVVFQTLEEVSVSPAVLKEIASIRSASDKIYLLPYDSKNPGLIKPFSGDDKQEHSFYIAHPHLFNITQKAILSFEFLLSAGAQRDMSDKPENNWFVWEYFNATYGNWVSLGENSSDKTNKLANNGQIDIKKVYSGEIAETTVNGIKNRWIRCRALTELTAATPKSLPEITSMKVSAKTGSEMEPGIYAIEPEMAFNNSYPIDVGTKTVPLKGIDVGKMWLQLAYQADQGVFASIANFDSETIHMDDILQFENGSEWIFKYKKENCIVFKINLPNREFTPRELSFIGKNNFKVSEFYPKKLKGEMIIAAVCNEAPINNKITKVSFSVPDDKDVEADVYIFTEKSSICNLIYSKGYSELSKLGLFSSVNLLTAIRPRLEKPKINKARYNQSISKDDSRIFPVSQVSDKDDASSFEAKESKNASVKLYLSTKDSPELSESRLLYFEAPNINEMPLPACKFTVNEINDDEKWARAELTSADNSDSLTVKRQYLDGETAYLIPIVKPFGEVPNPGDMFYLACDEAFSKRKALITISFNFSLQVPNKDIDPQEIKTKSSETIDNKTIQIDTKKKITFEAPVVVLGTVIIIWEYWNGDTKTWRRLNVIDTTKNLTQPSEPEKGEITFTCPEDFVKVKVNGEEKYWIRARLLEGHFGKEEYKSTQRIYTTTTITGATDVTQNTTTNYAHESEPVITTVHRFPIIKYITINYETEPEFPTSCLCLNNVDYFDATNRIIQGNNPFMPFQESSEKRDTLLFGFDKQLNGGPLRIYFHLKKEFPELTKAKTAWFYWNGKSWNELTVDDTTAGFRMNGYVTFYGSRDFTRSTMFDLSRFWLKVMISGGSFPDDLTFDGIYFNATEAIQSNLINDEQIGASNGTANQSFLTINSPIIEIDVWVREPSRPDDESMRKIEEEEPDLSLTEVTDNGPWQGEFWIHWHNVDDFDNTGSGDRHYRVDRRTGTIYFGNGNKGMIPPKGAANVKCSYRFGGGVAGNVEAGAISSIKSSIPYLKGVINPFKGDGGAEAETRDIALERGAQCLQHRNRAVTAEDFERLTLMSRAVTRAKCVPNIDDEGEPNPGWISILIIPDTKERPPLAGLQLISNVKNDLQKACIGTIGEEKRLSVRSPKFVTIRVEATLVPKVDDVAAGIVNNAMQALNRFFDPVTG
jgi:hypothetical protein